jgi:hypothetical protein
MVYFIIGAFIVFMVCLCIFLQKQANAEQKDRERPWRVVKNALGQYLLQHYCKKEFVYISDRDMTRYEWKWETLKTYDDKDEAIAMLNYKLAEFENEEKEKKQKENDKLAAQKEKELAETIVEIIK